MKKLGIVFVVAAVSVASVLPASAIERKYGTAGCGLGSMLLGDEPGMVQILAATLNGTAGNQTFGITSGTLNCEKKALFASNERFNLFVESNLDNLSLEIAKGEGESLATAVELLGVPAEQRTVVYTKLQENYPNIFPSENVEASKVIDNIVAVLKG